MNEYFRSAGISDDKERISYVESLFRGEARKWQGARKRIREPYAAFQVEFLEDFNTQERVSAVKAALYGEAQKENEPVSEFINKKLNLFDRIDPHLPEEEKAAQIFGQVDSEIRSRLNGISFSTVKALRDALINVERDMAKSVKKAN